MTNLPFFQVDAFVTGPLTGAYHPPVSSIDRTRYGISAPATPPNTGQ